ncbi:MAG TPA: hypothetical protein VKZ82_22250 [Nonomuraea sp.]|nr:hypothetical protein [Nonomuraea sp.]
MAERVADEQLDADVYYEDVERRAVLLVEQEARRHRAKQGFWGLASKA